MIALCTLSLSLSNNVVAGDLSGFSRPGGTAIVEFDTNSNTVPEAEFGQQSIAVVRYSGGWRAWVGLDTGIIPGDYVLKAKSEDQLLSVPFRVLPPHSPSSSIRKLAIEQAIEHVQAGAGKTNTNESDAVHPKRPECAEVSVKNVWRAVSLGATYMAVPIALQSRHLVNKAQLIQPGIWLQSESRQPVLAPATGVVIDVFPPESPSAALVIDHGQNMVSVLCPVVNPLVTVDAELTRGQPIGELAGDGRLWWTLMLNGQPVNPLSTTIVAEY